MPFFLQKKAEWCYICSKDFHHCNPDLRHLFNGQRVNQVMQLTFIGVNQWNLNHLFFNYRPFTNPRRASGWFFLRCWSRYCVFMRVEKCQRKYWFSTQWSRGVGKSQITVCCSLFSTEDHHFKRVPLQISP